MERSGCQYNLKVISVLMVIKSRGQGKNHSKLALQIKMVQVSLSPRAKQHLELFLPMHCFPANCLYLLWQQTNKPMFPPTEIGSIC